MAPLLEALCEADLIAEDTLLQWAAAPPAKGSEAFRRFAAPLLEWLRSTPPDTIEIV